MGGIVLFYYPELLGRLLSPYGLVKSVMDHGSGAVSNDTMKDVAELVQKYIGK